MHQFKSCLVKALPEMRLVQGTDAFDVVGRFSSPFELDGLFNPSLMVSPVDGEGDAFFFDGFMFHQMLEDSRGVEKINDHVATGFQYTLESTKDIEVFCVRFEIADGREQARDGVKASLPLDLLVKLADIAHDVRDFIGGRRFCLRRSDAVGAEIHAGHVPAMFGKSPCVPSRATSCIEQCSGRTEQFGLGEVVNESVSFLFAAVTIQQVVGLGVEPRLEPFRCSFPQHVLHFWLVQHHKSRAESTFFESMSSAFATKLVYQGSFSNKQADLLLAWTEACVDGWQLQVVQRKRVMRCAIEAFQNLAKHAGTGRVSLAYDPMNRVVQLACSNQVNPEMKAALTRAWDEAWAVSFEELRAVKRQSLEEGKRTAKGGAGLGLIDMRLCTLDHVQSEFIPCGKSEERFELLATIHPCQSPDHDE